MSVAVSVRPSLLLVCSSVPEVTEMPVPVVEVQVAPDPMATAPAASSVARGTSTFELFLVVMSRLPLSGALSTRNVGSRETTPEPRSVHARSTLG